MRGADRYITRSLVVAALLGMAATVPLTAQTGDIKDVPDPAIIKHGNHYYVFSTANGIEIRRSEDLWTWERIGTVFDTPLPSWAQKEVPGTEFPWAPDISYFNNTFHLYYSLSTFGGQRSVIALATNKTLDPASSDYRWVDLGKVAESNPGRDPFNAIDPAIIVDEQNRVWMSWGSFWGGIKMRRIRPPAKSRHRTPQPTPSPHVTVSTRCAVRAPVRQSRDRTSFDTATTTISSFRSMHAAAAPRAPTTCAWADHNPSPAPTWTVMTSH
jgi:beta-xylosidase